MKFWDKMVGNDITNAVKEYDKRAKELSPAYQKAWGQVETQLWTHSDFTGRNLLPIMDGVIGMLEEADAGGLPIDAVFEADLSDFVDSIAGDEGTADFQEKWRRQLNNNIKKKLGD